MPRLFTALWGAGVIASVMLTLPMSAIFFFIFLYVYTASLNLPVAEAIFLSLLLAWLAFVLRYFALVRIEIEDSLDALPRAYTKETYQTKCNVLFEHVYESYMGDGKSSYTEAA